MKHLFYLAAAFIIAGLAACGNDDKTSYEKQKEDKASLENIELFVTSCESEDSSLCKKEACIGTDCGIEDYYFTLKGNVIQRIYCMHEEDALWAVGTYRMSDSGIFCQMDRVYIVPIKYNEDMSIDTVATNYNRGKWIDASEKDPYLIANSACNEIRFSRRYTEQIRNKWRAEKRATIPFGRIYYEDKELEKARLAEMRQVKALADL